jgi:methylenetetrahydrofolate reductase (NADPH)
VSGSGGRLANLLDAGTFAVTGEVVPPRSADPFPLLDAARGLVGYVDAINVTDNPRASAHMSPVAGARLVRDAGVEPTLQLVCRDRNRLAITADLLGGWAMGARTVLVLAGDPMERGDDPAAAPVFDLTTEEVVALARRIRDEGVTASGASIADPPRYRIGVADVPLAEPYDPAKLERRLDAGAEIVWTQITYDVERLEAWLDGIRSRGVLERARVLVGVVPLRSLANARFLDGLYGVHVPRAIVETLEAAGDDAEPVGVQLTVDVVRRLRGIDGIAGVHLMGIGRDDLVRTVVERAGLFPRPAARPAEDPG